tara:strand:- start:21 stop:545 length:525 start_codon:yes stop_codon:yes gene_type:complete
MNRTMNEVEGLTFDGILKLSESKFGTKYTMQVMDVLYLHHLKSRGICGNSEDEMKSYLMKEGHDSRDTLKMIKRYSKVQDDLFEYTHRVNSIMDRVNSYGDSKSITSWEQVENLHMGIIKEDKGYRVVDISQGKEKLLARIDKGVYWISQNLSTNQMKYITNEAKMLKQQGGII